MNAVAALQCKCEHMLTHPSRWSAAVLAGCITMSNCATIQHVEGLLCVMKGSVAPMECRGTLCNVAMLQFGVAWGCM